MKMHVLYLLAGFSVLGWGCAQSAHAATPNYYVECYVDAGPHAYQPNSCYTYVQQGPTQAHAYFSPSTALLVLLGSAISPSFSWSVPSCNGLGAFTPCVVPILNHTEKTVSFSIPSYNLTRSAVAGYDMGVIP